MLVHSRRCDRAFRRFQRLIVSVCRTAGCNLQVQEGHTTSLQFQPAATCDVSVEDGLDRLDGLDLMSMD